MGLVRTVRRFAELIGVCAPSQGGLPTGGATGAMLAKNSSTNYDTSWTTLGSAAFTSSGAYDPAGAAATAVTALNATNLLSGTVPAARLPGPTLSTRGGVKAANALTHQFLTGIDTAGLVSQAQPSFADLSGTAARTQIGTGTPTAGEYVDGGTGAWTALPAGGGGSPGGASGQIQYNDGAGGFAGSVNLTFNGQGVSAGATGPNGGVYIGIDTQLNTYPGIWIGQTSYTTGNYSFLAAGGTVVLNAPSGGNVSVRVNNVEAMQISSSLQFIVNSISALAPNRSPLVVNGSASQSSALQSLLQISSTNTARECGYVDAVLDVATDAARLGSGIIDAASYNGREYGFRVYATGSGANASVFTSTKPNFQTGVGVLFIANATTPPAGNPSGGGFFYVTGGALKYTGSSGTTTTLGTADPHCPVCGSDFATEHDSPLHGYLSICLSCLSHELGSKPWITKGPHRAGLTIQSKPHGGRAMTRVARGRHPAIIPPRKIVLKPKPPQQPTSGANSEFTNIQTTK